MTMQQMNEYLEKRGFEVERTYMKQQGIYRFMIKKNGNLLGASFKYPETNDWHYKNERMLEFLEKIVRDFEVKFMDMDVASWYPDPEKFWTKENPHVRIKDYITSDIEVTKSIYKRMINSMYGTNPYCRPEIEDVIFNDPATIVFWTDGTKTVVKCQEGDEFDPEKGLTMAIAKKVYGNKGHYFETIKKWCGPYYEKQAEVQDKHVNAMVDALVNAAKKALFCTAAMDVATTALARTAELEKKKANEEKKDPEFVKVTEHYGYACLHNEDGDSEYYVVHKDELVNIADKDARDWLFHSKNRDYAVSMAHHLEYHHYISKGL